jgi:hypothetical protein
MTPETLQELVGNCPPQPGIQSILRALREPRGFGLLPWDEASRARLADLKRPLPMSLLPFGEHEGELLALDFSACAVERSLIPVLRSAPDGFWRPVAEALPMLGNPGAPTGCPSIDFRLGRARGTAEDASARSLVNEVLRRPLHTMESLADLVAVQERALDLEADGALDPIASRLAHAGLDPEKWRIVGAERAIAKRHRVARHALESAAFLGAPMENILPAWRGLTQRSGLGWLRRMFDQRMDFMKAGSHK